MQTMEESVTKDEIISKLLESWEPSADFRLGQRLALTWAAEHGTVVKLQAVAESTIPRPGLLNIPTALTDESPSREPLRRYPQLCGEFWERLGLPPAEFRRLLNEEQLKHRLPAFTSGFVAGCRSLWRELEVRL